MKPIRCFTLTILALASVLLLAGPAAHAQTGVILGGKAGMAKTNDFEDFPGADTEDGDFAWEALAGYQFFDWLAFEASYLDLGDVTAEDTGPGGFEYALGAKGWNFGGKLMVPLASKFGVHANGGVFVWEQDLDYRDPLVTAEVEDTGTSPSAGVGFHVYLNPANTLRLEGNATRYFDVGDPDNSGERFDRDFFKGGLTYFFSLEGSTGPDDDY